MIRQINVLTAQKLVWLALDLHKPHLGKDALEWALSFLSENCRDFQPT
jgi:hypothetical protein